MITAKNLALVIAIATVITYLFQIDQRYAKASDLVFTSVRMEVQFLEDERRNTQIRIWNLEAEQKKDYHVEIENEIRELKLRLKQIEEEKSLQKMKVN